MSNFQTYHQKLDLRVFNNHCQSNHDEDAILLFDLSEIILNNTTTTLKLFHFSGDYYKIFPTPVSNLIEP